MLSMMAGYLQNIRYSTASDRLGRRTLANSFVVSGVANWSPCTSTIDHCMSFV